MKNKKKVNTTTFDFANDDGTVDVWVFENMRVKSVTLNVRRRKTKK